MDVVSKIKEKYPNQGHPRLLLDEQDFENLKELIVTDPHMKKSFNNTIVTANAALNAPILEHGTPDGKRLPRTAANMMGPLAMAYKLTGNEDYKDRLWTEIANVAAFPDWNPAHFLDVGDYARPLGLVYDWMYHDWTPEQRLVMRNAIMRHALTPSMAHLRNKTGFARQTNNWNQVINSGIGVAMLAIADEPGYEALANEFINLTAESLPAGMEAFTPDGACPEGPGYWSYAQDTYYQYQAAMMSAMDFDFGLSEYEGFENTGYFPIALMGPTRQVFNFADGGSAPVTGGVFFWLARLYDQPELGGYQIEMNANGGTWKDLAMYRPDPRQADFSKEMPKDKLFRGEQNLASMRSSWEDRNALFVAFKGGYNQASHGDLDIGSFVMDAMGIRWVMEPGGEYYEAPGMWDFTKGGGRWLYYRKNVEGQNTLLINPKATEGQDTHAMSEIYKFESADSAAYGLIDMSEAYAEEATDVKRGIALVNNRSALLVQDEIKTKKASEIYSFFHTQATLNIAPDKKSAIMESGGKKMRVDLLSPSNANLIEMPATPLPTSPLPPYPNNANTGIRKLAVHMTGANNPTISVMFTPIGDNQPDISLPNVIPLADWDSLSEQSATVDNILVDGIPVDNFSPYNTLYSVDTGVLGEVTAVTRPGTTVSITQPEKLGDKAFVVVKEDKTGFETLYMVSFDERKPTAFSANIKTHEIKGVRASEIPQPENPPESSFDGDLATRWSAEGEQWIEWDLGDVYPLDSAYLSFMSGSSRLTMFNLEVSADGVNYTKVFDGEASGNTDDLELFPFSEDADARYLRFNGRGNSSNLWNSITEVSIPIKAGNFADTEGHWAQSDISLFAAMEIVNGVSETEFRPDASITRAEYIAIVARILNLQPSEYKGEFGDVSANDWYAGIISAAVSEGIVPEEMYAGGQILPMQNITREEMTAISVKAYEASVPFSDIKTYGLDRFADRDQVSPYAREYMEKGLTLRILQGIGGDQLAPLKNATRAEAVVIAKRLFIQIAE